MLSHSSELYVLWGTKRSVQDPSARKVATRTNPTFCLVTYGRSDVADFRQSKMFLLLMYDLNIKPTSHPEEFCTRIHSYFSETEIPLYAASIGLSTSSLGKISIPSWPWASQNFSNLLFPPALKQNSYYFIYQQCRQVARTKVL